VNLVCSVKLAVTLLGVRGLAAKSPTGQLAGNALQNIVFIVKSKLGK